ncbi:hypothetical protein A2U01_0084385, partial [Trifolium medium]|jgi:hypothetical protein
MLAGR